MARRRSSRRNAAAEEEGRPPPPRAADGSRRSVAAHVRDRQRAVAEREAGRLARPEKRPTKTLGHADRKKSAVSSTPFGFLPPKNDKNDTLNDDQEQWCGPFSVARQMIAQREEARRQREAELEENAGMFHPLDQVMEEVDQERKRKAHPSLQWKSKLPESSSTTMKSSSIYSKRQKRADVQIRGRAVPSLFQLCVNFLVDNFEYVEALGDVDNSVRTAVIQELVANKKMNGETFAVMAEVGIEALEIVDCSEISQDQLSKSLRELLPAGLRYLMLDQSGRCFGPKAVEAIITSSTEQRSNLFALSVGGAYLLKDSDAAKLVASVSKTVSSLEFKACPFLGVDFCKSLSESFSSTSSSSSSSTTLLELALEDLSLNKEGLDALIAKPDALKNLKSLSLRRIDTLSDDIVVKVLEIAGGKLERLDLSDNYDLTDATLSGIRRFTTGLRALSLAGLKHVTAHGLEALFLHVPNMASPPMLRRLDLGNCDHEAVTDDVINLVTQAATKRRDGVVDQLELLGGLSNLNIQGSAVVSDTAMEYLAATCSKTLQEINLSFCTKVTDNGLGYLVDKCSNQLSKIYIWGCGQLTDDFLDGHRRVDDPTLEIAGAWMKKNSSRTIR